MRLIYCLIALGIFAGIAGFCQTHADHHRHNYNNGSYSLSQAAAMDKLVAEAINEPVKASVERDCGTDWLCLVAWANEQHPRKVKRHG